jgi:Domain of unknown function (DUF929)
LTSDGGESRSDDVSPFVYRPDEEPGLDTPRNAQRRRATVILSAVVAVAVVAAALAAAVLLHKGTPKAPVVSVAASAGTSGSPAPARTSVPAEAGVLADLTHVSPSVADAVGRGDSAVTINAINGPPLLVKGKPAFLYVGGLFCPFCAAERWSMIQALSRFGSFTGLVEIQSSEDDLATFDFAKATYSSKYLAFVPNEIEGQNLKPLQRLTPKRLMLFKNYGHEGFPFLYVGGKYAQAGAGYDPEVLAGLTHSQIASMLSDASSPVSKSIVGEANVLTAAICDLTDNQPATVCADPVISGLQTQISGATSS